MSNKPKNELDSIPITLRLIDHKARAYICSYHIVPLFLPGRSADRANRNPWEEVVLEVCTQQLTVAISLKILARNSPVPRITSISIDCDRGSLD